MEDFRDTADRPPPRNANDRRLPRIERARMPVAVKVLERVAAESDVCIRPQPFVKVDTETGASTVLPVPCGATLAVKCPPCAKKAKVLRLAQCREGWHLDDEPLPPVDEPTDPQKALLLLRADLQAARDEEESCNLDTAETDALIAALDAEINAEGVRGTVTRDKPKTIRRSTKRRADVPALPRLPIAKRTVGRVYTAPDGQVYRPSMGITLTLPSYGAVHGMRKARNGKSIPCPCGHWHNPTDPLIGTPVNPNAYDYRRAARDAIHFPELLDRFWENLRRCVGWKVQYFSTLEPQKRLAPHMHAAIRGTIPREVLRQVVAATYASVWWPPHDEPVYQLGHSPVWQTSDDGGCFIDPDTGEALPTWEEALDAIPEGAEPAHVVRFGTQFDAQGMTAGSAQADKFIGYLGKYLTKSLEECHTPETPAQHAHIDRYAEALRFEPCSASCANWLLYGVQPKNPTPDKMPGRCRGKAHQPNTLGFGGRRVLVSTQWSGKTLTDHRNDRRRWVLNLINQLRKNTASGEDADAVDQLSASDVTDTTDDPNRFYWERLRPNDPQALSREHLLMRAIADRDTWREQLNRAKALAGLQLFAGQQLSATPTPIAA